MKRFESPLLSVLGGYWDGAFQTTTADSFVVHNPATTEPVATLPKLGAHHATLAVRSAARALAAGAPDLESRKALLHAIADAHEANVAELARIITVENGKPLAESAGEVRYAVGFYRDAARHVDALAPRTLSERLRGCDWRIYARPAGVAALITPFNFPLAMLAKKLSAAIAAGCPVVVKPAENTPLSAIALFGLLHKLEVRPGILNLVFGDAPAIGGVVCKHPAVRVVSFTGSTAVGQWLAAACAPHMKKLSLELGGNAPFVVFADADLEHAADQLMSNKFRCAGQTCVSTNRVLVESSVAESFAVRVAERVAKLTLGDGAIPGVDVGPLIDRAGYDKVWRHVQDAVNRGARVLAGGLTLRPDLGAGAFFAPTVLFGVTPMAVASSEETFGPVIAIGTFDGEAEAIARADDTHYGLAAYVFSGDAERLERVAEKLHFGHVGLNTATGPTPEAPFGGMRMSGIGREGGAEGIHEYVEWQTTPIGPM